MGEYYMDYTGFIKMLFVVAGLLGVLLLFSEMYEYIRFIYYRRYIYKNLNNIWKLMEESERNSEDVIENILHRECDKMYHQYVLNNKFLRNVFVSPDDLLIKFLTITNTNSDLKYKILMCSHANGIKIFESDESKNKIKLFEKVSLGVTIIGILVTVISFFI